MNPLWLLIIVPAAFAWGAIWMLGFIGRAALGDETE